MFVYWPTTQERLSKEWALFDQAKQLKIIPQKRLLTYVTLENGPWSEPNSKTNFSKKNDEWIEQVIAVLCVVSISTTIIRA